MRYWVFCIPIILITLASCRGETVSIDRNMRRSIDTLYRAQRDAIVLQLDSLCEARYDSVYPHLLDSVVTQREKERDAILKYRQ